MVVLNGAAVSLSTEYDYVLLYESIIQIKSMQHSVIQNPFLLCLVDILTRKLYFVQLLIFSILFTCIMCFEKCLNTDNLFINNFIKTTMKCT